jgi:hypothetical protein
MSNQRRLHGSQGQYNPGGAGGGGGEIDWASVPASSSATGTAGEVAYDGQYFYVCVATDTWVRTAISDWS